MTTAQETLSGYVNDMLAVEREIHQAMRRQKNDERVKRFPAVAMLIANIEDTIDGHIERLGEALARIGANESAIKKAVGTVLGVVGGLYDKVRQDDKVSRLVRDDYAALCFAIVCYEMLHTTALALGDDRVADMAIRHLADYAAAITRVSDVIPRLVVQELAAEAKVPADEKVAEVAVRHVRDAWQQAG
jgi:ferritin-like metal-binding protein YciE